MFKTSIVFTKEYGNFIVVVLFSFVISTYALGDLAIVVGVHQLEGLLVLGLLPRELLPGQHAVAVLVVRREHLVHVLSSENEHQNQYPVTNFSMRPKRLIHIYP